jgi:glucose/arabinose dehydrogenase
LEDRAAGKAARVRRRAAVLLLALACAAPAASPATAPAAVSLVQVGSFQNPVYVAAPLGDTSRVFVVEQAGRVQLLRDGAPAGTFLDLTDRVLSGGERGLLSIAFSPDYLTNGLFYVYYTAKSPTGAITIEEHRRDPADPDRADAAYSRIVLQIPHSLKANHNGGQLQFGTDGMLYAGTGDGGGGGDPYGNGQRTTGDPAGDGANPLLGKLLRIDPAGTGPGAAHLHAIGLRNPFRFSFDRSSGDLSIGDVGESDYEEIDFAAAPGIGAGLNYGWNLYEGDHTLSGHSPVSSAAGFTFPVIEHSHADGWCSIIGGYVVRDPALPELAGQYVYGDYCKNRLYAAQLAAGGATGDHDLGLPAVKSLSSFGEDGCGRVYAASLNGPVYRLASSGACAGPAPFAGFLPAGPPAAPPGGAGAGGPDTRAPVLTLRAAARQRALRLGYLRVRATCDEQCPLRASARIVIRRSRAGASAAAPLHASTVTRTLGANASASLRLALSRATRAQIARALARPRRRAIATITVRARDAAGNVATRTVAVRIV